MEQKLQQIYERASQYINGDGDNSPIFIIRDAASMLGDNLPEDITPLFEQCMQYANKGFDEPMSLEEYATLGYDLVEQISGALGEHFKD